MVSDRYKSNRTNIRYYNIKKIFVIWLFKEDPKYLPILSISLNMCETFSPSTRSFYVSYKCGNHKDTRDFHANNIENVLHFSCCLLLYLHILIKKKYVNICCMFVNMCVLKIFNFVSKKNPSARSHIRFRTNVYSIFINHKKERKKK